MTKTTKTMKMSESDIQKTCADWMQIDGWRPLKTDPCSDRSRAKGFGEKGMPDHLFIRYDYVRRNCVLLLQIHTSHIAEVLWVEFKRPGGRLAKRQSDWATLERKRGALVWLATEDFEPTIEGFQKKYRESGLMLRTI